MKIKINTNSYKTLSITTTNKSVTTTIIGVVIIIVMVYSVPPATALQGLNLLLLLLYYLLLLSIHFCLCSYCGMGLLSSGMLSLTQLRVVSPSWQKVQ